MNKTLLFSLLTTLTLFGADSYEGCGDTRDEALNVLSGNIISKIKSSYSEEIVQNGDSIQNSTSKSKLHTSTELALVNIKEEKKAKQICVWVKKEDQAANTKVLAIQVLSYKKENLPTNNSDKIKQLSIWLDDVNKLSNLVPVFYEIQKENEFAPEPKKTLIEKLQIMQKEFTDLHTGLIIHAESQVWSACGKDKNDALNNLSSTILSKVQSNYTQSIDISNQKEEESIDQKISSMLKVTSNLTLVNVKEEQKETQICLSVDKKDQVENTKLFLSSVMLYKEELLPNKIEPKLQKLKLWIEQTQHTQELILAFFKPSNEIGTTYDEIEKTLASLQLKEKHFSDLYNELMLQADSLIFKACDDTQEEAYAALNKKLFKSKTKKQDDEGILDKAGSFFSKLNPFSKKEEKMLDLFMKEVSYAKENKKECALITKESLFNVASRLNNEVARFNTNNFSKEHKERYTQIKDEQEHLNVTKALLELFSDKFTKNDFSRITAVKKELATLLESTFPQSITFVVQGAVEDVEIKLNDAFVKKDTKLSLREGKYTYIISAKGKCPIKGEISLDLLDEETINKDFSSRNYPTLLFSADKNAQILVDCKNLQPNTAQVMQKCEGEIIYIAEFASQKKEDTISLSPNLTKTIKLEFLTPQELSIFNDAKTKLFETTTETSISDSLTPMSSENMSFSLDSKTPNGEVKLHQSGSFTYISNKNFVGVDSFKYTLTINGKESAPKVVNITVNVSNKPVAPLLVKNSSDVNQTQEIKKELAQEEENRYQKFKIFVDSQEKDMEKMKKLQKTYPDLFDRLLKEKLSL